MALSALDGKSQVPSDSALVAVFGPAKDLWAKLYAALAFEYPPLTGKWGHSGKKWGWSLALKQKKRTIVYLTPSETFFYADLPSARKPLLKRCRVDFHLVCLHLSILLESMPKDARFGLRSTLQRTFGTC